MQAIDFSRSFLTFRIDLAKKPPQTLSHRPPYLLNNARIQLECRCEITDKRTGQAQEFVLGASCKTEQVGVERDIWLQPNADFAPVLSHDRFLFVKTFDRADKRVMFYPPSRGEQPQRQVGLIADTFDNVRINIAWVDGDLLRTKEEIVNTTLTTTPLMARTIIEEGNYRAVIDYPIKTMNANERDWVYQTDTGPILLPDFSREYDDLIAGLEFAYAAFNRPDWIELIVRVPTEIADEVKVYHYARPVRYDCQNQVIRLR